MTDHFLRHPRSTSLRARTTQSVAGVCLVLGMACSPAQDGAAPPAKAGSEIGRSATAAFDSMVGLTEYTGMWTAPLLAKRLTDQGMAVTITDSVIPYEHLSVPGQYFKLGRGDVHAFFYPDTLSASRDYGRLDRSTAAPPGAATSWPTSPTLVRSLNLIVIFLSNSPGHSERVANGILGGLAPPDRKSNDTT